MLIITHNNNGNKHTSNENITSLRGVHDEGRQDPGVGVPVRQEDGDQGAALQKQHE